jgi:hypothetical protein
MTSVEFGGHFDFIVLDNRSIKRELRRGDGPWEKIVAYCI